MKTLISILMMIGVAASTAFSQPMATPPAQPELSENGQELIDTFFDLYQNKGYEAAVKFTLSTNKWIKSNGSEMDNIILKLERQVRTMGEFLGFEELKNRRIGSRYRIVSYLVYYQRDPIRFTFSLYKTKDNWEITDFSYDSNFDKEVEESIKLAGR